MSLDTEEDISLKSEKDIPINDSNESNSKNIKNGNDSHEEEKNSNNFFSKLLFMFLRQTKNQQNGGFFLNQFFYQIFQICYQNIKSFIFERIFFKFIFFFVVSPGIVITIYFVLILISKIFLIFIHLLQCISLFDLYVCSCFTIFIFCVIGDYLKKM